MVWEGVVLNFVCFLRVNLKLGRQGQGEKGSGRTFGRGIYDENIFKFKSHFKLYKYNKTYTVTSLSEYN